MELFQESHRGVRLQGRELRGISHQGEPDAARRRGDHLPRTQVQPRRRGRLQTRVARRHRRSVPERLYHCLQRLQRPGIHRTGPASSEDGQAYLYCRGEAERAGHHCPRGQEAERPPQHRHPHQAGQQRQRQVGRERWRCLEVRTHQCRTAGGPRDARQEGHARLPAPHPLPHRLTDHQDTPHPDGPARSLAVLYPAAQDGLQRRFRGLWRRTGRRLRRHTLTVQRELCELLYPGIRQRLYLHLRRCCQQEQYPPPQHHH